MLSDILRLSVFSVEILYFASLLLISIVGFHWYRLCWLYIKNRKRSSLLPPPPDVSPLPSVTVQIPVYNEVYVIKRVIEAVCAIDYPAHLFEIQVLDDSTDETSEIAGEVIEREKQRGVNISHIRRRTRRGFKAGALKDAFGSARGEFIALFDADFVPPRDFLRSILGCFSDPRVGIAQACWGHTNMEQSLLTRLQSVFLDGHFVIEQAGRSASGLFLNFNGTASVIRRECLVSSGGWHEDTMAEDLDLSCRAQLKGWKIQYLKALVCPAEIPSDIAAFKSQQRRWTGGGVQNAKKFFAALISNKGFSAAFRIEAAFHLLRSFLSPLFHFYLFSAVVIAIVGGGFPASAYNIVGATAFAASGGIFLFYTLAVLESSPERKIWRFAAVPFVIVLLSGISISNAQEVYRCLAGRGGGFVRTPKTASVAQTGHIYGQKFNFTAFLELAAAGALLFCAFAGGVKDPLMKGILTAFSGAFLYVFFLSVKTHIGRFFRGS
ncbi:MAG: glycosyltransferase [Candidatus Mycalebacterium zealandia]|nr:MAG: glycosyltransferase [Candidatus Mycalebacterium zealandia]